MSFDRLGRFAVRRRWWIVGAWAVILLAALPFAPQAPGALSAGGFILDDLESARAKQVLQEELGAEPSAFVLVYSSDTLKAGTREWLAAVNQATAGVATAPHVTRILGPPLAPPPFPFCVGLAGIGGVVRPVGLVLPTVDPLLQEL